MPVEARRVIVEQSRHVGARHGVRGAPVEPREMQRRAERPGGIERVDSDPGGAGQPVVAGPRARLPERRPAGRPGGHPFDHLVEEIRRSRVVALVGERLGPGEAAVGQEVGGRGHGADTAVSAGSTTRRLPFAVGRRPDRNAPALSGRIRTSSVIVDLPAATFSARRH